MGVSGICCSPSNEGPLHVFTHDSQSVPALPDHAQDDFSQHVTSAKPRGVHNCVFGGPFRAQSHAIVKKINLIVCNFKVFILLFIFFLSLPKKVTIIKFFACNRCLLVNCKAYLN